MNVKLIHKIKQKKPLERLDDEYIEKEIEEFLKKNSKIKNKVEQNKLKNKDQEKIIKAVRNEINKTYGQFWLTDKLEIAAHKSTKERLENYDEIYAHIFSITGKPKTILDLGAGLNPITYKKYLDIHFIATELTDYDCNNLRKYFKDNKIKGEVIKADLREQLEFPQADLCFMFKLLESIELKGHKLAEQLITQIKTKYIVVSFSTVSIQNKRMNYPRRGWLEQMLTRLNYIFSKFETENEIFYIIKKQ